MLGSSIVTAVSWAKVSCNTSSSFSPSPSPLSATLVFVPPTGCVNWFATTPYFRSLCFCRNRTSSNVNLIQNHKNQHNPIFILFLRHTHKRRRSECKGFHWVVEVFHNKEPNSQPLRNESLMGTSPMSNASLSSFLTNINISLNFAILQNTNWVLRKFHSPF